MENSPFSVSTLETGTLSMTDVDSISQMGERRRVQELLRYFKPTSKATNSTEQPQVSQDVTLNAFAQLAAFRLNCQRSFISLMDHEHQYIIAECTRSMSLESAGVYEGEGDALLTGATTLDLEWGVCASTISVFNSTDGSSNSVAQYVKANKDYEYIMNDMSQLEDYKDRPYVANWPHMRYYVEVPIHSPSGLAIGTICAVTNEAREGIDLKSVAALREIAGAVMDHLDLVSSRVQRRRAEKMINGLGKFTGRDYDQGWTGMSSINDVTEDMRELTVHAQEGSIVLLGTPDHGTLPVSIANTVGQTQEYFDIGALKPQSTSTMDGVSSIEVELDAPSKPPSDELHVPLSDMGSVTPVHTTRPVDIPLREGLSMGSSAQRSRWNSQGLSKNVDEILDRATSLIREAVELSGLAFFDIRQAAPVQHANEWLDTASINIKSGGEIYSALPPRSSSNLPHNPSHQAPGDVFCRVLSSSIAEGTVSHITQLPESLLLILRDRFPGGGILNYNQAGIFQGGHELDTPIGQHSRDNQEIRNREENSSQWSSFRNNEFLHQIQKLPDIFPGAKKILLFPLTSSGSSNRLFAYAIGFTTDPTQFLQREDFAYITSFSNLLMVELARIDTADADLAKSRFISSISHELRSPLHGILASAELLKDAVTEPSCLDVIETIEACGSTLLDTLDNLLSFAKINHFHTAKQRESGVNLPPTGPGMNDNPKSLTSNVDMCALVEEVMDASIAGHRFNVGSMQVGIPGSCSAAAVAEHSVTVICDISSELEWMYSTQAGAWKRILMNLFGNSLKYTSEGYIIVKLLQKAVRSSPSDSSQMEVTLVVEDTGKGISKDYLEHDLYKPFHQEDGLQPGTGLGLSIVRQLVSSVNGSIDVSSEVGLGTRTVVKALLHISDDKKQPELNSPLTVDLSGLKIGFLGIDILPDLSTTPNRILSRQAKMGYALKSMLEKRIMASRGSTVTVTSIDSVDADYIMVTEDYYHSLDATTLQAKKVPLVLLSSDLSLDYRQTTKEGGFIVYLSQPFGPQRLCRALKSCVFESQQLLHLRRNNQTEREILTDVQYNVSTPVLSGPLDSAEATLAEALDSSSPSTPSRNGRPMYLRSEITSAHTVQPRVLLVEDNAINLRLLVTYIKKLDCPYETATDGQKAVESYLTTNGNFDVIFTDIQMPHKDGFAASLEIRQFEQKAGLRRTPIIAITGLASAEAQEQASISGIDLLLIKPVPMRTLKNIIDNLFLQRLAVPVAK